MHCPDTVISSRSVSLSSWVLLPRGAQPACPLIRYHFDQLSFLGSGLENSTKRSAREKSQYQLAHPCRWSRADGHAWVRPQTGLTGQGESVATFGGGSGAVKSLRGRISGYLQRVERDIIKEIFVAPGARRSRAKTVRYLGCGGRRWS